MKTNIAIWRTKSLLEGCRWLVISVFFAFALEGLLLAEETSKVSVPESPPEKNSGDEKQTEKFENWVTTSGIAATVSGDKAQFMQRHGTSKDFSGGVEDFFLEKNLSKDTTLQLGGHGLFDVHDYNFKLGIEKKDVGHWNVGYKEFRIWYDGNGGFFPQNGRWFSLYDNQMAVDRGEAWFEGELTLPDLPIFGFKYTHASRNGMKDSLSWGDSNLTRGFGTRNIVPAFRTLDERRDAFDGYMIHTVDQTAFKTGMRYETTAVNDSLNVRLTPFEATDRSSTQKDINSSSLFNFYGSTETWFSEKILFTTGYSLSTMNTAIGGNLIYGPGYRSPFNVTFPNLQANDNGFIDLRGGSEVKKEVVALNLMTIPMDDLTLTFGVRPEQQGVHGSSNYIATNATGALNQVNTDGHHNTNFLNVSETFEARYKGIKDWMLYARGDWKEESGSVTEDLRTPDTRAVTSHIDSDLERFNRKYTAGSNWYPLRQLNFGTQYYHQERATSYVARNDANLTGYPGLINNQKQTTDDCNISATWHPLYNVTSVTRYDYQENRFDSQMTTRASQGSGRNNQHIFAESITWNPLARLYFQGSANYSISRTKTPLNGFMGSVIESRNDYLTTTFTSGYALNDKTDLQLQYTYYFAPDYYDNSTNSVPYGSGAEEHGVTLSMIRRITENIQWTLKYGFFNYRDQLYGGFEDYKAHVVYTGLKMAF